MGRLLEYSGITTKIRAMKSRLLTDSDYRELSGTKSVTDALVYLKKKPAYSLLFANRDERSLHRNEIENILTKSVYMDYQKLYRFASAGQRKILDLYFGRYETSLIKRCMRMVFDHRDVNPDIDTFLDFFRMHSDIDLAKISTSRTVEEFVENLKGSIYYEPLKRLSGLDNPTLWDYETAIDLFYFKSLWDRREAAVKDKDDLKIFEEAYGTKNDLLNLQWISRSKLKFHLSPAQIYALLIPVHYRLRRETIRSLVEASGEEEFYAALRKTYYARHFSCFNPSDLSETYACVRHMVHARLAKQEPYTIATMIGYLYEKEHEIDRVTSALEGIRYGLPSEEILKYI